MYLQILVLNELFETVQKIMTSIFMIYDNNTWRNNVKER